MAFYKNLFNISLNYFSTIKIYIYPLEGGYFSWVSVAVGVKSESFFTLKNNLSKKKWTEEDKIGEL